MLKQALIIAIFLLTACSKPAQQAAPQARPVHVKYQAAQYQPITKYIETVGELKADKEILVAAERAGQIEAISVREGQWINAGEDLISVKGNDVKADLKKAQVDYQAMKKLYDQGAISYQELVQYESNLERLEAALNNLKIKAVVSGIIGEIYVDPGDYLKLGDRIMDLVKVHPLRVTYQVPEKLLAKLNLGQQLSLEADSLPGQKFRAAIDFISPRVDPATRSVLVRAKLINQNSSLKANQFVRVKQAIENLDQALMVREEALYLDQGQEYLYLAVASSLQGVEPPSSLRGSEATEAIQAQRVPVTTGYRNQDHVEILEGIKAGDNYIYAGLNTIYPGASLVRVED